jgi:hypothetical protein
MPTPRRKRSKPERRRSRVGDEAQRQHRPESARGKLCVRCSQRIARHHVNGGLRLCCECYVSTGHEPADWHPECMAAYAALRAQR